MTTHLRIGSLASGAALDLGPEHPTRAGLVDLRLEIADDRVVSADLQPGHLHRGAEKLFEVRDYRQVLMLADRHDWQSPFSGELGVALVCEHLWGLTPPPRATVLRTLLAEFSRICSHLAFLTFVPHRAGDADLALRIRTVRERARQLMLELSGNRLHPMLNRLGGLSEDAEPAWLALLPDWLDDVVKVSQECDALLTDSVFTDAAGVGAIGRDLVNSHGVSGPAARASGVPIDLRRHPSYLIYSDLLFTSQPAAEPNGDAIGRLRRLAFELLESVELTQQCLTLAEATPGPVNVKLSRIIKLPDAEARLSIEAPWGVAGFHLVSRGERTPWRLALRTPTFANAQALQQALAGTPVEWIDLVVASLAWTTGDLDK